MARWFKIGGPCNPTQNYMLPAMGRLPDVSPLLRKGQYFVVHAQHTAETGQVFDPDLTKPWGNKISSEDIPAEGKTIHPIRCWRLFSRRRCRTWYKEG